MKREAKRVRFIANGGRAGISERVMEIAREIISVGSYKRAIIAAGQIRALAEIAEADSYWDEKCSYGYQTEHDTLNGAPKASFNAYGSRLDTLAINEDQK